MNDQTQRRIADLTDKIALELVFAEPGKDIGLLPVNCLLSEIENSSPAGLLPPPVAEALGLARQWVDAALDAGALDAACLGRLAAWCGWVRDATAASAQGQALPAFPSAFLPSPTAAPPSAVSATPTEAPRESPENEPLILDVAGNADLLREFIEEAQEHLHRIELDALALEKDPADAGSLNSLFRSFHTVKGGSGFLNLGPMNRLAHQLEALLDLCRQNKLRAEKEIIDLILSGRDTLRQFVVEIDRRLGGESRDQPVCVVTAPLLQRIRSALQGQLSGCDRQNVSTPPSSGSGPHPPPGQDAGESPQSAPRSVKVDTAKLDSLIDLVGELVIAQSLVVQDSDLRVLKSQQLSRNLVHLGRITNDLQHIAMSLRMVPIRATFQKMSRLVRDLAAKQGKSVELRVSGEHTELDRNLIEQINDPLIHMLRNAVDHGIEAPDRRKAQGKPEQGIVHLRAFHQGGNVVIEIADDGAGLNKDRILAKALQQGIVSKDAQLAESDIFGLIFLPGFSTAEKVTEISGRGVGMDVVRRNIAKLRGKIDTRSIPGQGSTFSIHLPLTLAIIDGLIFSIGPERFIVPTLCVCESFRPEPGMISTVHGRGEMVRVRGQFSPLIRLYQRFGLQPETTDPTQAIIIVVETHDRRCGLLVDRLLGKQEVVIKGLGDVFKQSRALAGAAILGDGRVGLILDVNGLVQPGAARLADN